MIESARDALLRKHRQSAQEWFDKEKAKPSLTDAELMARDRKNRLDALRQYDPLASLREELLVTLSGGLEESGALNLNLGAALLPPLGSGLSELAEKELRFDLVGISSGSTVLHLRPAYERQDADGTFGQVVDSSPADPAVRQFLDILAALEAQADVGRWAGKLSHFAKLAKALDEYDVHCGVTWLALDGSAGMGSFSSQARRYLYQLEQARPEVSYRVVTGRVTELKESGYAKVKTGVSRTASAFEIKFAEGQLLELSPRLGETVSFRVREIRQVDRLGAVNSRTYEFLESLSSPDHLDFT